MAIGFWVVAGEAGALLRPIRRLRGFLWVDSFFLEAFLAGAGGATLCDKIGARASKEVAIILSRCGAGYVRGDAGGILCTQILARVFGLHALVRGLPAVEAATTVLEKFHGGEFARELHIHVHLAGLGDNFHRRLRGAAIEERAIVGPTFLLELTGKRGVDGAGTPEEETHKSQK